MSEAQNGGNVMERLTQRLRTGEVLMASDYEEKFTEQEWIDVLQNRLAAYEETWLTPEEFHAYWVFLEDLIGEQKVSEALDNFRQLVKADRDGRLVVLPCKVDDTVYFALLGRIIEKQVFSIVSFSNSTRIYCDGTSEYFRPEDIGKTFFLTREEAEKALEAKSNA